MHTKPLFYSEYLKIALETNYYISAIMLIALTVIPFKGYQGLFLANTELYGPLGNNLQLMGFYMALIEFLVWLYCFLKKNFSSVTFLGLFHLLIPNSLQMYAEVNDLPIDPDMATLFWYTGLSHILFGFFALKEQAAKYHG